MFSERIRLLRSSYSYSQLELAKKLGVSKQSVSNWEDDNIMPSVEMLERVANFFEVTTDYLLGRNEGLDEGLAVDVTGLNRSEIDHIRQLVEDLRKR